MSTVKQEHQPSFSDIQIYFTLINCLLNGIHGFECWQAWLPTEKRKIFTIHYNIHCVHKAWKWTKKTSWSWSWSNLDTCFSGLEPISTVLFWPKAYVNKKSSLCCNSFMVNWKVCIIPLTFIAILHLNKSSSCEPAGRSLDPSS